MMMKRVLAPFKRRIVERLEAKFAEQEAKFTEQLHLQEAKFAEQLDLDSKFAEQEAKFARLNATLEFLELEVSDLRMIIRHISAESDRYKEIVVQTRDSFDYQWGNITEGESLLSDGKFLKEASSLVVQYTGLPAEWFQGRRILDAGCGNGRWSATLIAMGADVTAFDVTKNGVRATLDATDGKARVFQHNILDPLEIDETFDLVWSYGVLHHTGDTWTAFKNIEGLARSDDGYLVTMLYGEPRTSEIGDYRELIDYQTMRREFRGLPLAAIKARLEQRFSPDVVHGFFDAVSPLINDCYSRSEVIGWYRQAGFTDISDTVENRNIHIIGRRTTTD